MRNTLLASLLVVTAACTTELAPTAPAQGALPSESAAPSVRGTQRTESVAAAPVAPRAPAVSSTSPNGPVWIETTCEDTPVEAQLAQFKLDYLMTTAIDLGKAALLVDHGVRQQLTAWDSDSNCHVDVTAPKDVDTVAIARTLLAALRA